MWRNKYISVFLLLFMSSLAARAQFGNEWINFNQSYYKIKIVKDDFYRITQQELQAVGFPASTINAEKIQLFRRGEEVAIRVNATNNVLNYLEFYGEKNDGESDKALYDDGDQPHTFHNLFSDTATYFLTYTLSASESGKRIAFSADKNTTGLTLESYHLADSLRLFTSSYATGLKFGSRAEFSLSKYDDGEGWTGEFQTKNAFKDFVFNLNNQVSDINPILEMVISGGNSLGHNVQISAGPDNTTLTLIENVEFTGWGSLFYSGEIDESLIGPNGELNIRVLAEGFPGAAERFAVAYVRVLYPQTTAIISGRNKILTIDNPSSAKSWMRIQTTDPVNTDVFDITDTNSAILLAKTNSVANGYVEVVVPNVTDRHKVLATSTTASVAELEAVSFTNYSFSENNYLIITHPLLRNDGDPVGDYESYRESIAGGEYDVLTLNINEVYDLFNYGDPSPLGIANLIKYHNSVSPLGHVFLIGKGFTPNFNYYRGEQSIVNIPTFGLPGGDLMYTLDIETDSNVPGIPIGRLNAFKTSDVSAYLNKIIEMEALPFEDLWRKNFLQLSGGSTTSELNDFADYIQDFTEVLEDDFIGGRAFNTGKRTDEAVEYVDVTNRVNEGVGYITFFGHSGGNSTDIEIGRVSQTNFGFSNRAKYPIFLVNGCKAGEIFGSNFTFGEDWMITPNLGSIGLLAHTDVALSTTLKRWSDLFYRIGFADEEFIGKTVGEVLIEVSKNYYLIHGSSNLNLTQLQQMQLQGDPAYRIFGADHPDYSIDINSTIASAIDGGQILSTQDSLRINIVVNNFGKTVSDSLEIQIDRVFADGGTLSYNDSFLRPLRQDSIEFFIPLDQTLVNDGINTFIIRLDPENAIEELNEANNTVSIQVPIFAGSTFNLFPIDNGTQSVNEVQFMWQSSNVNEDVRSYDLEFDTQPDFMGSNRRSFQQTGQVLLKQDVDLSAFSFSDSTTLYWRTRFTNPSPNESAEWVESSFTIINSVADGWGQYKEEQIASGFVSGVEFDNVLDEWKFIESETPIEILTYGDDNLAYQENATDIIQTIVGGVNFMVTSTDEFCELNTFNAIAFDKESGDPYRPIVTSLPDVSNREVCGRLPQRIYQFREADMLNTQRRFSVLIDNMQNGDMIVLFNIGNVNYSLWDAEVLSNLNELGISSGTISSLTDGQPVIFFGRKGDAPGTATVLINDGSATPITQQSLGLQADVIGKFTSGSFKSRRIGPAKNWMAFSYNLSEKVNDVANIELLGVDRNGVTSSLIQRGRAETIDISNIDPILYPQIELLFDFQDVTDQTPPQLNLWELNYDYPPEGLLVAASQEILSIQEGEEIRKNFYFYNFSSQNFTDSLTVMATMINQNDGESILSSFKIAPPTADDTTLFTVNFPSFEYEGFNSLLVDVSANENEMYTSNNDVVLINSIEVEEDVVNPILDVTFDGYHILNGDIVSPQTVINARIRDDNPFIFKSDTVDINLSFKQAGEESRYQRINFSDPRLNYTLAAEEQDFEIEFVPGPLDDGIYGLQIEAEDEAGNESGSEPYEVTFEVINKSTVTHFYPYPNPFSTQCRFVFTLTGNVVPDEIKIQILTVSGRVVREITQSEIGTIRIGNNITEYAWDGRDEYGDQLANGVYFYKVFINSNGDKVDQRTTSADRAFKHGYGKLYILR